MAYESQTKNEVISVSDAIASRRGKLSTNYSFNVNNKTLTINDTDYIKPLFVANVTRGTVLYNPTDSSTSGTIAGAVITLNKSTVSMANADELAVLYEATELNSTTLADILTELLAQGITLDSTLTELLAQGVVQDSMLAEQAAQGVVQDNQLTELLAQGVTQDSQLTESLDQGTTLDSIETEQADQGTTLDSLETEQTDQGATLDSLETEQLAQGVSLDTIITEQSDQGTSLDSLVTEQAAQGIVQDNTLTEVTDQGTTLDSLETEQLAQGVSLDSILTEGGREYFTEVCKGNVTGQDCIHKFGANDSVPNGTWAFVSTLGQTTFPLTAATTVRVKAGNAADTAAGAGAREVTVQGIDDSFNEVIEAIATAGGSASSATTASFWRVHRMWVSSAGTYEGNNTGDVVIENSAGGTDIITMSAGDGQTLDAVWTVPIGKTAYLISAHITVDATKPADVRIYTRENMDDTSVPVTAKRLKKHFIGLETPYVYRPSGANTSVNAKGDIWAEARGGGAASAVSVDFELLIIDD